MFHWQYNFRQVVCCAVPFEVDVVPTLQNDTNFFFAHTHTHTYTHNHQLREVEFMKILKESSEKESETQYDGFVSSFSSTIA